MIVTILSFFRSCVIFFCNHFFEIFCVKRSHDFFCVVEVIDIFCGGSGSVGDGGSGGGVVVVVVRLAKTGGETSNETGETDKDWWQDW